MEEPPSLERRVRSESEFQEKDLDPIERNFLLIVRLCRECSRAIRDLKGWGRKVAFRLGEEVFGQEQRWGIGTGQVIRPVSSNKLVLAS